MRAKTFAFSTLGVAALLATMTWTISAETVEEVEAAKRAKAVAEERAKADANEEARRRDMDEAQRKTDLVGKQPDNRPLFKVYEWGAETWSWTGKAQPADDIPSFYYRADQIELAELRVAEPAARPKPVAPDPGGGMDKKPVLYFDCDDDVKFGLQVQFIAGEPTYLYPKANRRPDARTLQWDEIQLHSTRTTKPGNFLAPSLKDVKEDHWASFSRKGSTSSLVVNGEHENFIFYEGTNKSLPEVDIFMNEDGHYVVRNYTPWPIYNLRWTFSTPSMNGDSRLCAREVPAAKGDSPSELVLKAGENGVTELEVEIRGEKQADLATESSGAGLTSAQAEAFARAWHSDITGAPEGTLSYRRDAAQLDALMRLTVTLPSDANLNTKIARVGYVVVTGIDLGRQAELDGLAANAANADKDAAAKLLKEGMAGIGAVRRAMADKNSGLKQRMNLAKVLQQFNK
ncbi:MAG: hypothetical protein IT462_15525 [Planctomycetes bacterium]|nr:hypothetical protein [Planctomycetota bacterium]